MFRRRKPKPPDWSKEEYTYRYDPIFRSEPWRSWPVPVHLVPVDFCYKYADPRYLREIGNLEHEYIERLRSEIDQDGLKRPCIMRIDEQGKTRFHDGYHRLVAISGVVWMDKVPIVLEWTPKTIRGYGRPLHIGLEDLLGILPLD